MIGSVATPSGHSTGRCWQTGRTRAQPARCSLPSILTRLYTSTTIYTPIPSRFLPQQKTWCGSVEVQETVCISPAWHSQARLLEIRWAKYLMARSSSTATLTPPPASSPPHRHRSYPVPSLKGVPSQLDKVLVSSHSHPLHLLPSPHTPAVCTRVLEIGYTLKLLTITVSAGA